MTAAIRPPALRYGGRIALVTPAWPGPHTLPTPYRRGVAALRQAGYRPVPMPHTAGRRNDWTSGTARQRAADINRAFADPTIDAVLCTIGGDHSVQVLPHIDFAAVAANPKPFCGYSDVTVLHHGIHTETGLVTFYGPALIPQWGTVGGPLPYTVRHFVQVIDSGFTGPVPTCGEEVDDLDFARCERLGRPPRRRRAAPRLILRAGSGRGPLLAACLPSARAILATQWQPDYAGRVLVLDIPAAPYSLAEADADLTHLRLAGCLDELAALLLCRTRGFPDAHVRALHDLVLDHTAGRTYPVLARVEGGHSDPMPTWPIGVTATVDGDTVVILDVGVTARQPGGAG